MKVEDFKFGSSVGTIAPATSNPLLDANKVAGKDECLIEITITGTATVDIVGRVSNSVWLPLVEDITSSGLYSVVRVPEMAIDVTAVTGAVKAARAT